MSVYVQANTNGRLHPAHEPSLSPLSRGFLYGDAIYEVWRTYHGVLFAWEEHWRRLENSAVALHMPLPFTREEILFQIRRTVEAYFEACGKRVVELYVRLQLARGAGHIGLDTALAERPDTVILVQPNPQWSPEKASQGLHLSMATLLHRNTPKALNPAWKTGNYLNNILCLREARARGADEVVIANHEGEVTEAAVSNIAFVRGNSLATPPMSAGILGGITRELVLSRIARYAGLEVSEESIRPSDFGRFSECCLLSTTKDVSPVASIDEYRFEIGGDTRLMRLKTAFTAFARDYADAHPELRIF